jgi:hypothetical protein
MIAFFAIAPIKESSDELVKSLLKQKRSPESNNCLKQAALQSIPQKYPAIYK